MNRKNYIIFGIIISIVGVITRCNWPLNNPSDSGSSSYTVESKATVTTIGKTIYDQFDTVYFAGGITSEPVAKARLVKRYDWDLGNDGDIDTTLYVPDTLGVPMMHSGSYTVRIRLTDGLGFISEDIATILVAPKFRIDVVIPEISLDTSCAFYSQNEYTMRPVVLLGRYLTYRNKTESMSTGNFIFELLKNLTGTIDYNTIALPYKKNFSNGVYTLENNELSMKAAFLYGSTINGHNENDTVRYDLFDPSSYIRSFKAQLSAPYYSFEEGPLWDLTSGFNVDVSNPLKPKINMNIDFTNLKFTGFREVQGRYTLSAQMSDTNTLSAPVFDVILFNYHGFAKIEPILIRDILSLVEHDSLEIDMSGSTIVSDSFPVTFTIEHDYDTSRVQFDFQITQQMIMQKVRFGNSGGNNKVKGSYQAQSRLSVEDLSMVESYFSGVYSTTAADTVFFFCDREMTSQFGTLYFDVPQTGLLTFVSDKYKYQFTMREGLIAPE